MLRGGQNARATVPERPVRPRVADVIDDLRAMVPPAPAMENSVLLASADMRDAYQHFRVHPAELRHCLTRDWRSAVVMVWVMMSFGLKSAPLLWGRLAAAMARLIQGMYIPGEARLQLYMDDPLWALTGSPYTQRFCLAMGIWTFIAFGVSLSWGKGQMGALVEWIGVSIDASTAMIDQTVRLTVLDKFLAELTAEISHCNGA
eukprot:1624065-Pyramimonas_sp.AAC.1